MLARESASEMVCLLDKVRAGVLARELASEMVCVLD